MIKDKLSPPVIPSSQQRALCLESLQIGGTFADQELEPDTIRCILLTCPLVTRLRIRGRRITREQDMYYEHATGEWRRLLTT